MVCTGEVPPEKLGGSVSWNPYSISDQNLRFSLPYFRPDQNFDTLFKNYFQTYFSCYTVGLIIWEGPCWRSYRLMMKKNLVLEK